MSTQNHFIDQDQLVKEIQERRPEALNYLYDNYSSAIYGSILRIVTDEDIAKEVLQDAFMKFWDKIDKYDPSKGRFFTWMINISRNLSIDKLRSKELKKAQKTDDLGDYVNDTKSAGSTHQDIDGIGMKEAMRGLRDEEKFVLEMVYFKGYTQSEIEKEFGIPLGTIKTRLRMALVNMRKILNVE
ncbi:MAG: sigma-70 family RNA polymerase sigma factor [Cyclobacteriaceae bacterium]